MAGRMRPRFVRKNYAGRHPQHFGPQRYSRKNPLVVHFMLGTKRIQTTLVQTEQRKSVNARQEAGSRRQDTDKAAGKMQNAVGGLKDAVRGKQRASTVNGACHGNDFNNRCVSAAVWRWRRVLGSQSGLLVIRFCAYARAPRRVYVQSILNPRGVGHT